MVSIGAVGGISEGDYITWTKKWVHIPSNGISSYDLIDVLIDERNGTLSITWEDGNGIRRFGIYKISDFSAVFESPVGAHFVAYYPNMYYKSGFGLGMRYYYTGGVSQSIQTYLLLLRYDKYTIDVWRGGASALWSRNTRSDFGADCYCYTYGIGTTGTYILTVITEAASPYDTYLMLYEGS